MVEDVDLVKQLLLSLDVTTNKNAFSDYSVIKLISFFFSSEIIFDAFSYFEKSCDDIA